MAQRLFATRWERSLSTRLIVLGAALCLGPPVRAAPQVMAAPDPASGTVDCTVSLKQRHNPQLITEDADLQCFEGYLSKFGTWPALESGDTRPWGIPQWTIHRVDRRTADFSAAEGKTRPRAWFTIPALSAAGVAPRHEDYLFSAAFRKSHPNWYDRGHLTQKYLAERIGGTAGWFTHNVVNAVPQRSKFNAGAWLTLECFTGAWANESKSVWIITGPVFIGSEPRTWLQSDARRTAFPIAIPDGMFKIVARQRTSGWEAMGFLYLQEDASYRKGPWSPGTRLVPIDRIEQLTGLRFADDLHPLGMTKSAKGRLWAVSKFSFDPGCKKFAEDVP